jgi:hypothetical protein
MSDKVWILKCNKGYISDDEIDSIFSSKEKAEAEKKIFDDWIDYHPSSGYANVWIEEYILDSGETP